MRIAFMSRNVEKAQSGLNRYHQDKLRESGVLESNPSLRPKVVQKVTSLPQAEKWRSIVLSEISVRLTRVQDLSKTESDIRQINDELNKLFKEKRAWEHHVKALGGPDYLKYGANMENTGENDPYNNGYRYYGRAKELSDVKQLLAAKRRKLEPKNDPKQDKPQKQLDANYYSKFGDSRESSKGRLQEISEMMKKDTKYIDKPKPQLEIPSNEEISKWVIQKRKQELLDRL